MVIALKTLLSGHTTTAVPSTKQGPSQIVGNVGCYPGLSDQISVCARPLLCDSTILLTPHLIHILLLQGALLQGIDFGSTTVSGELGIVKKRGTVPYCHMQTCLERLQPALSLTWQSSTRA